MGSCGHRFTFLHLSLFHLSLLHLSLLHILHCNFLFFIFLSYCFFVAWLWPRAKNCNVLLTCGWSGIWYRGSKSTHLLENCKISLLLSFSSLLLWHPKYIILTEENSKLWFPKCLKFTEQTYSQEERFITSGKVVQSYSIAPYYFFFDWDGK